MYFEQADYVYYPTPASNAWVKVKNLKTRKEEKLYYKLSLEKEKSYSNHLRIHAYCDGIDGFIEHIHKLLTGENEVYELTLSEDCRKIKFV